MVGVGGVDDPGHPQQRGVGEAVLLDDHIERAQVPPVVQGGTRRVERDSGLLPGYFQNLGLGDEEELGLRVDEPGYQPRAGDAVHVHVGAGDPPHRTCLAVRGVRAYRGTAPAGLWGEPARLMLTAALAHQGLRRF